uniref:Uncharacterized protein n=1 Tax=Magallana gigas TaxID=29159 RepID=K1S6S2_MAGGI
MLQVKGGFGGTSLGGGGIGGGLTGGALTGGLDIAPGGLGFDGGLGSGLGGIGKKYY